MGHVMEWHYDPTDQTYILAADDYQCRVWHTPSRSARWAASVTVHGIARESYGFTTPEAAQAWCMACLGEFRTQSDQI